MYALLKFVHVLAVILFLGNVITGLFWKAHADRTKDPKIIGHTDVFATLTPLLAAALMVLKPHW